MSTLKVTNIQATGETASRAVSGVAAAWVFYTTKTTTSITDSNNVSSLSDLGTGRTEITVTNAYSSSTSYNVATFAGDQGTSTAFATDVESTRNTTTFGIDTRNTSNTRIDCNRVSATTHGDLA